MSALHFVGKRGAIFFAFRCIFLLSGAFFCFQVHFFAFRCIFLMKYFAVNQIICIFVYQIRQIKNKNKSYENNKQNNVVNS